MPTTATTAEAFADGLADLDRLAEKARRLRQTDFYRRIKHAEADAAATVRTDPAFRGADLAERFRMLGETTVELEREDGELVRLYGLAQAARDAGLDPFDAVTTADPWTAAEVARVLPTAARTEPDHRRDIGARTSRRRDTGQRATGGRGDDDSDSDDDPRLTAALALHAHALHLVPLTGKRPNTAVLRAVHRSTSWAPLRERPASAAEVRAWFNHDPATNVGIILTGDLIAVDIDRPERFPYSTPATPCVQTGRGWHHYFRGDLHKTASYPWGEVKATGYVVAPPSIHPETCEPYRWSIGLDDAELAPLPPAFFPLSPPPNPSTRVEGAGEGEIAQLAHDPQAVGKLFAHWGFRNVVNPSETTRPIRCPLHDDETASGSVYRSKYGAFRFWCHAAGCGAKLSVAEMHRAFVNAWTPPGRGLRPSAAAWWVRRAWHDCGVRAVPVTTVELPGKHREIAAGFRLMADLRTAEGQVDAFPFTAGFAADWCGVPKETAETALKALRDAGWLDPVGPSRPGVGYLYAPPSGTTSYGSDETSTAAASGSVAPSSSQRIHHTERNRSKPSGPSSPIHAQNAATSTSTRSPMPSTVPADADRMAGTVPAQGHDPDPPRTPTALDAERTESAVTR